MRIYCGIDGTSNNDSTLVLSGPVVRPETAKSYVRRISLMGFDRFKYIPGPKKGMTGHDTGALAKEATAWVEQQVHLAKGKSCEVYLGGFSRGAAAAINAAYRLNKSDIPVSALFLMDAVDRTYSVPFWTVWNTPKNVHIAFHALRASSSESRPEFSNIILRERCISRSFHTTHGGIGGWPIDHFDNGMADRIEGTHKTSTPSVVMPSDKFIRERWPFGMKKKTSVSKLEQISGSFAVWNWMSSCVISARIQKKTRF